MRHYPDAQRNIPDEMAIKILILRSKYENFDSKRRVGQDYKKHIFIKTSVLFVAVIQTEESLE